jgi:hypothetical protein
MRQIKSVLFVCLSLLLVESTVIAKPAGQPNPQLPLSAELMGLLRAEMQALLGAVQTIPAGIATGDWHQVVETSAQVGASYILEQKLTASQRQELKDKLPALFKHMDAAFHAEAKKLEAAAKQHNAQLASFHYYRMLETCSACHADFASTRFPGFAQPAGHEHGH